MSAEAEVSGLPGMVARMVAGEGSPADVLDVLRSSVVWCVRPERPGFAALGVPGDGMVPVFSSLEQLAMFAGATDWFSTTGADLLGLLPPGYDLVLDAAGVRPVRLHAGLWADAGVSGD